MSYKNSPDVLSVPTNEWNKPRAEGVFFLGRLQASGGAEDTVLSNFAIKNLKIE